MATTSKAKTGIEPFSWYHGNYSKNKPESQVGSSGNQVNVAKKLAELKAQEQSVITVGKKGFMGKNAGDIAFEKAKVEGAANAAELMAEMKAEEGNFNIKREFQAQQKIEDYQKKKQIELRKELSQLQGSDEFSREYDFTKVGQYQPKPVVVEKPTHVYHDNATQTGVDGVLRDAIGREKNQTWTNVGQESYVGQNTDELAFEAIEAIKNEEKAVVTTAEYTDPHKYNRDRKGQIITNTPAHNQLHSEVTRTPTDYTISGDAIKTIVADEVLNKDLKSIKKDEYTDPHKYNRDNKGQIITNTPAHNQLHSEKTLPVTDYTISGDAIEAIVADEALADDTKDAYREAKNEALRAKITEEKAAADLAAAQKQAWIDSQMNQVHSVQTVEAGSVAGMDSASTQYNDVADNMVEIARQAEQDAILQTSKQDMQDSIEKLREERLAEETAARLLQQSKDSGTIGADAAERVRQEKIKNLDKNLGSLGQDVANREKLAAEKQNKNFDNYRNEEGSVVVEEKKKSSLQETLANNKANEYETSNENQRLADEAMGKEDQNYSTTPAGLISNDPYAFSTHAYPSDVVEDFTNGHYMLFYVNVQNYTKYLYDGYDDKGNEVTIGDMVETDVSGLKSGGDDKPGGATETWHAAHTYKIGTGASEGFEKGALDREYAKRRIARGGKGNLLKHNQVVLKKSRKGPMTGLSSYYPTTTRITDSVAIYLPPNVQDNTSATYNDFQTGMAGFLAMGGVNILQQLKDHDFQGAASVLMGLGSEIAEEALKKFALGGFGALTGSEGVRETFDKAFGQSLNPYLEVTFDNMGLRSFSYTFHFAPKSAKESLEVKDIIQLFRFHMAPELKGTNHRYLTLPSTFDIHYMYQSSPETAHENQFYNKIATCVLQGCNVDYTPDGVKSFEDGAPTQINMTLNFKETKMLTKQKINDGF